MYSNRGKKTCELASGIPCCDMSSFPLQLNFSVEGCQKEVLATSTVCLVWISSQAGMIQCALYLWNKLLFPLCKGKHFRWGLPLRLCGHTRCREHNPAGWCCMGGVCLQSEVRLPDGRNESLFSHSSVCVAYQGLYLLWTLSWSQMVTFLITGHGLITLAERHRSTKQWLHSSKHHVCRRAEQWLLMQLLSACRAGD